MAPKPAGHIHCHNSGCTNLIPPASGPGRPRKYCDDKDCRRKKRRTGAATALTSDTMRDTQHVREITQARLHRTREVIEHITIIENDTGPQGQQAVRALLRLWTDIDLDDRDLQAAIIQLARDRDIKVNEIARTLGVGPDKLRRDWPNGSLPNRMRLRRERLSSRTPAAGGKDAPPGHGHAPLRGPRNTRKVSRAEQATTDALAEQAATDALAAELSALKKQAPGVTLRDLGVRADVTASYISRVLSGDRFPSWRVVRSIAAGCQGNLRRIRTSWEAAYQARTCSTPEPDPLCPALHTPAPGAPPGANQLSDTDRFWPNVTRGPRAEAFG